MENMSLGTLMIKLRVGRQVGGDRASSRCYLAASCAPFLPPPPALHLAHTHLSASSSSGGAPWSQLFTIQAVSKAARKPRAQPVPMGQKGCKGKWTCVVILTTPSLLSSSIQHSPIAGPRRGSVGAGCGGIQVGGEMIGQLLRFTANINICNPSPK